MDDTESGSAAHAERESWLTYGEPPAVERETSVISTETTRAWIAQEEQGVDDAGQVTYPTTRAATEGWLEEHRKGGYVYFEKLESLALFLAEQVDQLGLAVLDLSARLAPIEAALTAVPVADVAGGTAAIDPHFLVPAVLDASTAPGRAMVASGSVSSSAQANTAVAAPTAATKGA